MQCQELAYLQERVQKSREFRWEGVKGVQLIGISWPISQIHFCVQFQDLKRLNVVKFKSRTYSPSQFTNTWFQTLKPIYYLGTPGNKSVSKFDASYMVY